MITIQLYKELNAFTETFFIKKYSIGEGYRQEILYFNFILN